MEPPPQPVELKGLQQFIIDNFNTQTPVSTASNIVTF